MPLNFSDTVPAAPSGKSNVKWQVDGDNNISAYTDGIVGSPTTTKGDLIARSATADSRLPVGTDGQILTADSTQTLGVKWAAAGSAQPYDVVASYVGKPTAAALVLILTHVRAVSFGANFSGSYGTLSANPTATATYTVKKNGTSIGTVAVSTGGVFTFATSGGASQSFAAGDRMTIEAPSPADTTLADVGLTFAGTR